MNGIITVSLSPVIDIHYTARHFSAFKDNIADERLVFAAGKGMNVSRALHAVGISAEAHMLLGEENASEYLRLASDYCVPISCMTTDGAVRENISVNTPEGETRICMRGSTLSPQILPVFALQIIRKLSEDMAVVFSGSLPSGISQEDFVKFVLFIKDAVPETKIILDCPSLTLDSIRQIRPFLIKPNHTEAAFLLDPTGKKTFNYTDTSSSINAAKALCNTTVSEHCVVSCGPAGAAYVSNSGDFGFVNAPIINTEIFSTVGAGDSMLAGILYSFLKESSLNIGKPNFKYNLSEAVKWGVVFGSAACISNGTNPPKSEDIYSLYSTI